MNILTFDIEEWFHILDHKSTQGESDWAKFDYRIHQNCDRILNYLEETNQKASFFCLGWIGEKFPEVIRKISDQGYEIGSHTHLHQLIYTQTQAQFEQDLARSIYTLEDIIGSKIKLFRAPGFSIIKDNLWALESLIKHGIETDSSIFPAPRQHGGIADFAIKEPFKFTHQGMEMKEFPINTRKVLGKEVIFSGGGYFRLFPYSWIKRFTFDASYVMTYFHPRDFDPGQPIISDLSFARKFKSYYGLKQSFDKLVRYTAEFEFIDIATATTRIDWSSKKVVPLGDLLAV